MDILIKNMEMPKTCAWREKKGECLHNCFLYYYCHAHSVYTYKENDERPSDCPLVALPEHGRLVSAEDFIDSFEDIINECRRQLSEKGEDITVLNYFHDTIVELMGYMPTVLEANNGTDS